MSVPLKYNNNNHYLQLVDGGYVDGSTIIPSVYDFQRKNINKTLRLIHL